MSEIRLTSFNFVNWSKNERYLLLTFECTNCKIMQTFYVETPFNAETLIEKIKLEQGKNCKFCKKEFSKNFICTCKKEH